MLLRVLLYIRSVKKSPAIRISVVQRGVSHVVSPRRSSAVTSCLQHRNNPCRDSNIDLRSQSFPATPATRPPFCPDPGQRLKRELGTEHETSGKVLYHSL